MLINSLAIDIPLIDHTRSGLLGLIEREGMPTSTPMPAGHPGERVLLLRRRLGIDQEELAKRSHLGIATIRRLENGVGECTQQTLRKLADALHTTPICLMTPLEL